MKIVLNNDINKDQWLTILGENYTSSPFQSPVFFDVINSIRDFSADVIGVKYKGVLASVVVITIQKERGLKGYFSRRGVIYGGPLFNSSASASALMAYLNKHYKYKAIYLETRNFFDYSSFRQAFEKAGWMYEPYLNFQLNLKGVEKSALLSHFKYNRRREIKQSIANGASYALCENEKDISEVYNILAELYKTRVKLPLPPLDYFLGLHEHDLIKVFSVKHQGKIIGGSFCPFLSGRAIYTYYYCGLRDYHKRIFPTHLAVLAAMEYAIANYIPVIDFMGAGKPDVDYGVRKYKSEFGGTLVEHGRFIKVLNPFMYNLGKLGLKILSKIK